MKRLMQMAVCGWLGVLAVSSAGVAAAGHFEEIDRLAHGIEDQAAVLRREAVHFRGTHEYGHYIRDTNTIRRLAAHVRLEVDRGRRVDHIRHDVEALHKAVTHLGGLVDAMWHQACPGSDLEHELEHVQRVVARIERSVRHLERHLDSLSHVRTPAPRPRPVPRPQPRHSRPSVAIGHGGVSIGHGGVRIHFGF